MFNTNDFFKENPPAQEEVVDKKKPVVFTVYELMNNDIYSLFAMAGVSNYFDKYGYSIRWKKILQKEITRLKATAFSNKTQRQIQKFEDKINLMERFALTDKGYDWHSKCAAEEAEHAEQTKSDTDEYNNRFPVRTKDEEERYWLNYIKEEKTKPETVEDDSVGSDATKPREGGYKERDEFAIELVKNRPELLGMRPGAIKADLQAASNLFTSGYPDWWRNNPIFPKGKSGANPK